MPEINAGRVLEDYGDFHPGEAFLDTLLAEGVAFTIGSDAHEPGELTACIPRLEGVARQQDLPVVELDI